MLEKELEKRLSLEKKKEINRRYTESCRRE